MSPTPSTFIAGIGYYCLSDYGVGPLVVDILSSTLSSRSDVVIEDLSYSAVAAFHRLQELRAERYVVVGSVKRGWEPGSIRVYKLADVDLPDREEVQRFIGESVSGAIDLRSLAYIVKLYGKDMADRFIFVEIEPREIMPGNRLSEQVYQALPYLFKVVLKVSELEEYYSKVVMKLHDFVDSDGNMCRRGVKAL